MLENCKDSEIDYTKPIIVKWWQYNSYFRINKYELVNNEVHMSYLSVCNDINIPELDLLRDKMTHIKDNLYWFNTGKFLSNKEDLEYMLTHPLNVGMLTDESDLDSRKYYD